jgi:Flp pilus assembly protein TadG
VTVRTGQSGQAAVELVAVLPVLAALMAGVWQAALVGHASWAAAAAARAAARAEALGLDARRAARAHLPAPLERGLRVHTSSGGEVVVTVRVPSVLGGVGLGHASARAAFVAQR